MLNFSLSNNKNRVEFKAGYFKEFLDNIQEKRVI